MYTSAIVPVLKASKCHTLDRDDMRAQKDICGIGKTEQWMAAVEAEYRINHWPYVNAKKDTAKCFEKTLRDSPKNLAKDGAGLL